MKEFRTHKWPLNVSNFTWMDRLKIAGFFLNPSNRWTMGNNVKEFENQMANFVGSRYAVFTSSGSTANTLLAMWLKDSVGKAKGKNTVIFPSTTWVTSIAPFIREGFTPKFIDISIEDLSMSLSNLESYLRENADVVAAIFITSLIGLTPNISKIQDIATKYGVLVMMDNCENTFGTYQKRNVSSYFTSTTSTYFGHQIQSVEGGFVFCEKETTYDRLLMYRNHGMVRSLEKSSNKSFYVNQRVDPQFDFFCLGNNYRNTDVHALIGLLDFKRIDRYIRARNLLFDYFTKNIDPDKYVRFLPRPQRTDCMFCIPIISKPDKNGRVRIAKAKKVCENSGIEYRPIISGNLLRQTCFKLYGSYNDYPISEYVHEYGFYVGLHPKVEIEHVYNLVSVINRL